MFGASFNLTTILAVICTALSITCWILWRMDRHDDHRADVAEAALAVEKSNEKIVTKFVDRVVQVPGPPVIRERLVRGVCHTIELPSPGSADAAARADAADRLPDDAGWFSGELSKEVAAVSRNQAKLDALHQVLGPQARAE